MFSFFFSFGYRGICKEKNVSVPGNVYEIMSQSYRFPEITLQVLKNRRTRAEELKHRAK